ncbi:MAG TPA: hypothetical protein VN281_17625 [Verrucomicrobiae bacterium]|nr:hypothetical protein [Verrucomicrobiae bacterium]
MASDLGGYLTASNGLRLQQAFSGPALAGADGYSRGAYVYSNLTWALPGNAVITAARVGARIRWRGCHRAATSS